MKKYKRDYFSHYGVGEQDVLLCVCGKSICVDLHHLVFKSQGGSDHYTNLIPLCRACHDKAHSDKAFNESLKRIKGLDNPE